MTPITCAVIIIHYSNVQLILIVYNTANTSAQTLIENTDRKMINYRATMSLMSNSEPSSSHSEPLSHMHDGDAPHLFPQSAKKDALNILLMVKCVWKKTHHFSSVTKSLAVQQIRNLWIGPALQSSPISKILRFSSSVYVTYMTEETTRISDADFRVNLTWFRQILVKNMWSSPSKITVHKWKGFQVTCSV